MKKNNSKLFTINIFDLIKSVFMFFLSAIGDISFQVYSYWLDNVESDINWGRMFQVAAVATISYLIKQFVTGNKQPLEPIKPDRIDKITE